MYLSSGDYWGHTIIEGVSIESMESTTESLMGDDLTSIEKTKTRIVKSAFGIHYVESNWKDNDWENYQFNLKLMDSVSTKAVLEHRNLNKDEKKFIEELKQKNQQIRLCYMTEKEILGVPPF